MWHRGREPVGRLIYGVPAQFGLALVRVKANLEKFKDGGWATVCVPKIPSGVCRVSDECRRALSATTR
jgi:hypothetical protein